MDNSLKWPRMLPFIAWCGIKTVNFSGGRKLEVCFYVSYFCCNELKGYVDTFVKFS